MFHVADRFSIQFAGLDRSLESACESREIENVVSELNSVCRSFLFVVVCSQMSIFVNERGVRACYSAEVLVSKISPDVVSSVSVIPDDGKVSVTVTQAVVANGSSQKCRFSLLCVVDETLLSTELLLGSYGRDWYSLSQSVMAGLEVSFDNMILRFPVFQSCHMSTQTGARIPAFACASSIASSSTSGPSCPPPSNVSRPTNGLHIVGDAFLRRQYNKKVAGSAAREERPYPHYSCYL